MFRLVKIIYEITTDAIDNWLENIANFYLYLVKILDTITKKHRKILIKIACGSILVLLGIQIVLFVNQKKIRGVIMSEFIENFYNSTQDNNYKITFEKAENVMGIFSTGIVFNNVKIANKTGDFYIKSNKIAITCNVISCLTGKYTINPDISIEFQINNNTGKLIVSFAKYPKITVKKHRNEIYVYYFLPQGTIFNIATQKNIANFNKIHLMLSEIQTGGATYFKIIANISAKNIFGLDYEMGNQKSIFLDTGSIDAELQISGNIRKNSNNIIESSTFKMKKFNLRTAEFNIKTRGQLDVAKDLQNIGITGNIQIEKYQAFLDYIGTLVLNLSNNPAAHKTTRMLVPYLFKTASASKSGNTISLDITTNYNSEIYVNNQPLNFIIANFYQHNAKK